MNFFILSILLITLPITILAASKNITSFPSKTNEHNPEKPSRIWNLRNVDIRSVVSEVSRETGKNFILDPRVQGKISIIATTPVSPKEVYPIFLAALQISGYSVVPHIGADKIIPSTDITTFTSPMATNHRPGIGDEVVTRVVPIRYVSAMQLVPLLRPLLKQSALISAYAPSNMIILGGTADNLQRLVDIIHAVDTVDYATVSVIPLKNATAQDMVTAIKALRGSQGETGPQLSLAADERNNAVLISGSPDTRLRLRILISELDKPTPGGDTRDTQIIPLQFLQVKDILPILAGVAKSHYAGPVETIMGTRTLVSLESSDTGTGGGTPVGGASYNSSSASPNMTGGGGATAAVTGGEPGTPGATGAKSEAAVKRIVSIIGEPNTNTVIVNAPPAIMTVLKQVINDIDIRPPQVSIEAIIAEVDDNNTEDLGIEWGAVTDNFLGDGSGTIFRPGFGIIPSNQVVRFEAQIHALATNGKSDVLSTPSVVVLDNHLAHISVGTKFSVNQSTQPGTAGGTASQGVPFNTQTRETAALDLKVTPQVGKNGTITLNLIQKNDTLIPAAPGNAQQQQNPNVNISEIATSVIVNDGDILVFGGVSQNTLGSTDTSVPILGAIPVLGTFFHHVSTTNTRKKLMIFLHAKILRTAGDSRLLSNIAYDKQREKELKTLAGFSYEDALGGVMRPLYRPNLPLPFANSPPPGQSLNHPIQNQHYEK